RISDVAVLGDAIRRIADGECVVDPTIISRMMSRARGGGPLDALSTQECELLALVAEGRSNDAIGERLAVEPANVYSDLRVVFDRLGITTTPDDLRRVVAVLDVLRS